MSKYSTQCDRLGESQKRAILAVQDTAWQQTGKKIKHTTMFNMYGSMQAENLSTFVRSYLWWTFNG